MRVRGVRAVVNCPEEQTPKQDSLHCSVRGLVCCVYGIFRLHTHTDRDRERKSQRVPTRPCGPPTEPAPRRGSSNALGW
jgi:hypothetical protein